MWPDKDAPPPAFDANLAVGKWVADFGPYRAGEATVFSSVELRAALDAALVVLVGDAGAAAVLLRNNPFARWRGGELR